MPNEITPKKLQESGNAKLLESLDRLIAGGAQLDQTKLNPPLDLTIAALQAKYTNGLALHTAVGNSKADFRTSALARNVEIDKFDTLASQSVAQLAARGASKETVEDGRGYVRKIHGSHSKPKAGQDPASPNFDPTEKNISASQQSSAAKISTFLELVDFLEAQNIYANVNQAGLLIGDLRAVGTTSQNLHTASIADAAQLAADRNERAKFFYLDPDNICDTAARYKNLVKGTYGAKSVEYKTINAIPFKKRKK